MLALAELGIEGEFCASSADAAGKISTQGFQILIADWADQPDTALLLKTAKDQKAANRPLTLAIVPDDARLPEALRGGANSVLVRPLRGEQVRDTLATACELLRSKQSSAVPHKVQKAAAGIGPGVAGTASLASFPAGEEKSFRAGEFLQSAAAPGAQVETESELQKSLDQVGASAVDALSELEPMASAVSAQPAPAGRPKENPNAITGWASVQSRLSKREPLGLTETEAANALPENERRASRPVAAKSKPQSPGSEDELSPSPRGEPEREESQPAAARGGRGALMLFAVLAFTAAALVAFPLTRHRLLPLYKSAVTGGKNWLNPKPAPPPQAVTQHDSFGQSGDEYKLPATEAIPDATTDPSQIQIVPVLDPTAKGAKGAKGAEGAESAEGGGVPDAAGSEAAAPATEPARGAAANAAENGPGAGSSGSGAIRTQPVTAPQAVSPAGQKTNSILSTESIPNSLRSQAGSMAPDASGTKPEEAAMNSIEPVVLPEAAAWTQLAQKIEPEYPSAAKAAGPRGSVTLQILIGRDGAVQDAKFVQGSLVFARVAIDAVRQWKFKPYVMNGRAVQVQSTITLGFKPPS
jgi:TonB family protein